MRALVIAVLLLGASGCSRTVALMNKLDMGMSRAKIVEILGEPRFEFKVKAANEGEAEILDHFLYDTNIWLWPIYYESMQRCALVNDELVFWGERQELLKFMKYRSWDWTQLKKETKEVLDREYYKHPTGSRDSKKRSGS